VPETVAARGFLTPYLLPTCPAVTLDTGDQKGMLLLAGSGIGSAFHSFHSFQAKSCCIILANAARASASGGNV
jgi:hypothetical protein